MQAHDLTQMVAPGNAVEHAARKRRATAGTDDAFRREWQRLVEQSDNLYVQYQTPEWFDHVTSCDAAAATAPVTVRNGQQRAIAIVPYREETHALSFVLRSVMLARHELRAVAILGGVPLAEAAAEVHDRIYETLAAVNQDADCLYLHSVNVRSFAWHHLRTSEYVRRNFLIHLPRGVGRFHSLNLPTDFDTYLKQFRAKKRYNLNRQLRLLQGATGDLHCERIDSPKQVASLLEAAERVLPQAWQRSLAAPNLYEALRHRARLDDLAERGLLRSYVLRCAGAPRALVLGYQHCGIFHYAEIAYDRTLAHLSPGNSLLYLLIRDLIEHRRPAHVNFGIGDAEYKRTFGNVVSYDASVILFRRTLANRWRYATHKAFTNAVRTLKRRHDRGPSQVNARESVEITQSGKGAR